MSREKRSGQSWVLALSDDTNAVKLIFDHFRNVGIAAAIIAAGAWNLNEHASSNFYFVANRLSSACLFILGAFLFVVNELHAWRKFRAASIPESRRLVMQLVYVWSILILLLALVDRLARGGAG